MQNCVASITNKDLGLNLCKVKCFDCHIIQEQVGKGTKTWVNFLIKAGLSCKHYVFPCRRANPVKIAVYVTQLSSQDRAFPRS